jgi:hypothetical protein
LFRPLPAGQKRVTAPALSTGTRQFIALLLAVGGLCLVVGPFWDESWHRQFGIPFGQDFFWRPHMLLYFGFGSSAILGFWGLYHLMRNHQGTLQQRFRANMLVGLIVLSSAFLMYVVPADPVWHFVYGKDLSAWSVPHLLLLITIAIVMLMAAIIQLSTVPERPWRGIQRIGTQDVLPLLMYAGMMMPWLQILIIDWDRTLTDPMSDVMLTRFRPEWLMAACIVFTAAFAGVIANRSLRYAGAATLAGMIALALRYAMIQIFNVQASMHYEAWILALVPLLAIDLVTAYKVFVKKSNAAWWETGLAAAAGMMVAIPLFTALYPSIPVTNLVMLVAGVLAAGLGAGWLGYQIGEYAATQNKQIDTAPAASYAPLVSMGTLVSFVVFVIIFINTAAPPV